MFMICYEQVYKDNTDTSCNINENNTYPENNIVKDISTINVIQEFKEEPDLPEKISEAISRFSEKLSPVYSACKEKCLSLFNRNNNPYAENIPADESGVQTNAATNTIKIIIGICAFIIIAGLIIVKIAGSVSEKKSNTPQKPTVSKVTEEAVSDEDYEAWVTEEISEFAKSSESVSEKPVIAEDSEAEITVTEAPAAETEAAEAPVIEIDTTEAAKAAMREHMKTYDPGGSTDNVDKNPKYAFYDVNSDGIDELFITYNKITGTGTKIYLYKNDQYILCNDVYGASYCPEKKLIRKDLYGGGHVVNIYKFEGSELIETESYSSMIEGAEKYKHNGSPSNEAEYNRLSGEYDSMNWIYIDQSGKLISQYIDISPYVGNDNNNNNSNQDNMYDDWEFDDWEDDYFDTYDGYGGNNNYVYHSYYVNGCVNAGTEGLNIRSTPEITSDNVIGMFSSDTIITIDMGISSSGWLYATGKSMDGKTISGYVFSEYVDFPIILD